MEERAKYDGTGEDIYLVRDSDASLQIVQVRNTLRFV